MLRFGEADMLRTIFLICLAIWFIGGFLRYVPGALILHEIGVNIFGPIAIVLGLILLGRFAWRKMKPPEPPGPKSEA